MEGSIDARKQAISDAECEVAGGRGPPPGEGWVDGAGGTRTHDLGFRKALLYPAELQPLIA